MVFLKNSTTTQELVAFITSNCTQKLTIVDVCMKFYFIFGFIFVKIKQKGFEKDGSFFLVVDTYKESVAISKVSGRKFDHSKVLSYVSMFYFVLFILKKKNHKKKKKKKIKILNFINKMKTNKNFKTIILFCHHFYLDFFASFRFFIHHIIICAKYGVGICVFIFIFVGIVVKVFQIVQIC